MPYILVEPSNVCRKFPPRNNVAPLTASAFTEPAPIPGVVPAPTPVQLAGAPSAPGVYWAIPLAELVAAPDAEWKLPPAKIVPLETLTARETTLPKTSPVPTAIHALPLKIAT